MALLDAGDETRPAHAARAHRPHRDDRRSAAGPRRPRGRGRLARPPAPLSRRRARAISSSPWAATARSSARRTASGPTSRCSASTARRRTRSGSSAPPGRARCARPSPPPSTARSSASTLTRMRVELNGRALHDRVLNEALFCHSSPAATSRYILRVQSHERTTTVPRPTRSSPRRSTSRAASGWVPPRAPRPRSAAREGIVLPLDSPDLQYVVREPYRPHGEPLKMTMGLVVGRAVSRRQEQDAAGARLSRRRSPGARRHHRRRRHDAPLERAARRARIDAQARLMGARCSRAPARDRGADAASDCGGCCYRIFAVRRRCLKPGAVVSCAPKELLFSPLQTPRSGSDQAHGQHEGKGFRKPPLEVPEPHRASGRSTHALAVRSLATHADGDDRAAPSWATFVNSFASQDWLLIGYLVAILVALAFGKGTNRSACIVRVSADLGALLFVLALVRLQILRWGGAAASLLYRFAIMATLLGTFFQLREILPAVSPWALDAPHLRVRSARLRRRAQPLVRPLRHRAHHGVVRVLLLPLLPHPDGPRPADALLAARPARPRALRRRLSDRSS